MSNKRCVERDPCAIEAEVMLTNTGERHSCLITDISEDGARLELTNNQDLPIRFDLLMPVDDEIVDRRPVELRWQRDRSLGVRFVQD